MQSPKELPPRYKSYLRLAQFFIALVIFLPFLVGRARQQALSQILFGGLFVALGCFLIGAALKGQDFRLGSRAGKRMPVWLGRTLHILWGCGFLVAGVLLWLGRLD